MPEIRTFPVPKKSIAIWRLGRTGYIFNHGKPFVFSL